MLNATPTCTTQSKAPSNKRSAHTTGAAPNCYKHGYTWTRSHDQPGRPYSNSKTCKQSKAQKRSKAHQITPCTQTLVQDCSHCACIAIIGLPAHRSRRLAKTVGANMYASNRVNKPTREVSSCFQDLQALPYHMQAGRGTTKTPLENWRLHTCCVHAEASALPVVCCELPGTGPWAASGAADAWLTLANLQQLSDTYTQRGRHDTAVVLRMHERARTQMPHMRSLRHKQIRIRVGANHIIADTCARLEQNCMLCSC